MSSSMDHGTGSNNGLKSYPRDSGSPVRKLRPAGQGSPARPGTHFSVLQP